MNFDNSHQTLSVSLFENEGESSNANYLGTQRNQRPSGPWIQNAEVKWEKGQEKTGEGRVQAVLSCHVIAFHYYHSTLEPSYIPLNQPGGTSSLLCDEYDYNIGMQVLFIYRFLSSFIKLLSTYHG